ncbi:MAG TPA: DUF896 domain-containing protein [Bacillota bacterium]|nr:DUF896 domain-containing protein [Bacillota bacterium]
MISDKELERINTLARKSKKEGLTKEEKSEQYKLRQKYLKSIRQSFKNQLHSVKVIDPEGTDVTPKKLKEEQNKDKRK